MARYRNKRKEVSKNLDKKSKDRRRGVARATSHQISMPNNRTETTFSDPDLSMNESRETSLDTYNRKVFWSDNNIKHEDGSEMSLMMSTPPKATSDTFSCIMDLPPNSPWRHSFKIAYRLTKEEINQSSLDLEARVPRHPSTRNRTKNISNSRKTANLSSLPTTELKERSSTYRQAQSVHHTRETIDRSSLPSQPARQGNEDRTNSPSPSSNRPSTGFQANVSSNNSTSRSPTRSSRVSRLLTRWVNHGPFFHFDQVFGSFSSLFNRGFDEDGFFFFSMNNTGSQQDEQKEPPRGATKEEIEKAVSQLTGLSSDLEIKKGDSCPICLEQFKTTDNAVEMPCSCKRTFFHRQCAVKTLEMTQKIKCPNCREWDEKP